MSNPIGWDGPHTSVTYDAAKNYIDACFGRFAGWLAALSYLHESGPWPNSAHVSFVGLSISIPPILRTTSRIWCS